MTNDASDEQWLPVVGYEDRYLVSSDGRIWAVPRVLPHGRWPGATRRTPGRYLSVHSESGPVEYKLVSLINADRQRSFRLHTLVLRAFHGPCPEGWEARHLNGDPTCNTLDNLAWGTRSENNLDRVSHGTDPRTKRTHCPYGHRLAVPNLVRSKARAGRRNCLACSRARAKEQRFQARGWACDFKAEADWYYSQLRVAEAA